jgi:hypothetical protein
MEKKKNIAASVRNKLTDQFKKTGENLQTLFVRYANERFLYRLSQTEHRTKFLVKGATVFAFWFNEPHRPTKDLDLLGYGKNEIPEIENIIREVCAIQEDDGLDFLTDTIKGSPIREDQEYQGVRVTITVMLERARIPVQIDVGFGDTVTPKAEEVELNTILDFPAPRVRIYPKETVVAEKFEAMVSLGLLNGRMKDFWDLNYLIKYLEFDGKLLQNAVRNTFANRQRKLPQELPVALTDNFAANELKLSLWSGFIRRNNIKTETDFAEVIKHLLEFFTPLIEAEAKNAELNQTWLPQTGWQ